MEPSPVGMTMAFLGAHYVFISQEGNWIFFSHDFTFPPVMANRIVSLKNAVLSHNTSQVLDPFPVRKFLNYCIKNDLKYHALFHHGQTERWTGFVDRVFLMDCVICMSVSKARAIV
jgi:hypothetical protein